MNPKPDTWPRITAAWDEFQRYLDSDTPPPLTDRDTRERPDAQWQKAAAAYIQAKRLADEATTALDSAKAALVTLASHTSESGAGVKVTRFWKAGAVDYKRVPQLKGVDLGQYRGAARQEVRVTTA